MVLKATVKEKSSKESLIKSVQKQPSRTQMFLKIGVSQRFLNRKTPVLKSAFNRVAGNTGVFL